MKLIKFIRDIDTDVKVVWSLLTVFMFWLMCVNHTDPFNVAITYNTINGEIGFQTNGGWHVTSPFVRTSEVPHRQGRVSIDSNHPKSPVIDDKIVKFVLTPEALIEFVKIEGFHYAYSHHTLMPYAFSGKKFPFFEIIAEYKSSEKN